MNPAQHSQKWVHLYTIHIQLLLHVTVHILHVTFIITRNMREEDEKISKRKPENI